MASGLQITVSHSAEVPDSEGSYAEGAGSRVEQAGVLGGDDPTSAHRGWRACSINMTMNIYGRKWEFREDGQRGLTEKPWDPCKCQVDSEIFSVSVEADKAGAIEYITYDSVVNVRGIERCDALERREYNCKQHKYSSWVRV